MLIPASAGVLRRRLVPLSFGVPLRVVPFVSAFFDFPFSVCDGSALGVVPLRERLSSGPRDFPYVHVRFSLVPGGHFFLPGFAAHVLLGICLALLVRGCVPSWQGP